MPSQIQALVVGAGISGLATAFALSKARVSTVVIDSAPRPGGVIQSVQKDGYLLECGPQSFSGNASITALCTDVGILDQRVLADPKAPRYVLINGALQSVPMGPGILASPLMSGGTRSAILRDIFGSSHAPADDESVANFIRRKFSPTLLDRLVGPFVSGIYAGDPEKLSLRATFPILHEAESAGNSVLRGIFPVLKARKAARGDAPREKATLQTFRDGNETLVNALGEALGEQLQCGVSVTRIESLNPGREPRAPRFRITVETPGGTEFIDAERLIIALPTNVAGNLLQGVDAEFSKILAPVEYAGIAVVSLGYRKENVANPLTGFGFLVPRSSGLNILGSVWNSSLFPGRAPEGHALMTSFIGGATNPAALTKSPEELVSIAHGELSKLLGIKSAPAFSNVTIWPRAIPQYNLGHTQRLAALETCAAKYPGLYFAGNYLKGPAIGTCVEQALKTADDIRISFAN